jgi:hypothetical protein
MLDALPDKPEPCNPFDSWGDARFGHLMFSEPTLHHATALRHGALDAGIEEFTDVLVLGGEADYFSPIYVHAP